MMPVDGPALAVAAFCEGRLPADALARELEVATLFVLRVAGPGGAPTVAAVGPPGAGYVAVFTTRRVLAAYAGECDWAAAAWPDLLDLVPAGYGVVIDPPGPWTALLPASAITRGVVVAAAGAEA